MDLVNHVRLDLSPEAVPTGSYLLSRSGVRI
jgi:hypothetical protein